MKVKFGMMITDGLGKLGGHVVQRNAYGLFARTYVVPANPQTLFQQDRRAIVEDRIRQWPLLTDAQRAAWQALTADYPRTDGLGNSYFMTGQNLFVSLNLNLWMIGQGLIDAAPVKRIPDAIGEFSVVTDVAGVTMEITLDATYVDADALVICYATAGLSAGINYVSTKYRSLQFIDFAGGATANIETSYQVRFTFPIAGDKVFYKLLPIDLLSGTAGIPFFSTEIVP